jgi:hypothetical protein
MNKNLEQNIIVTTTNHIDYDYFAVLKFVIINLMMMLISMIIIFILGEVFFVIFIDFLGGSGGDWLINEDFHFIDLGNYSLDISEKEIMNYEEKLNYYMDSNDDNGYNLKDWSTEELQETRGQTITEIRTNTNLSDEDRKSLQDLYDAVDKEIYDRAMAENRAIAETQERLETILEENEEEYNKRGTKRSLGSTFQDDFVEKKDDVYGDDSDTSKKGKDTDTSKKPRNK